MTEPIALRVAVVGHTNTGKTSLMRTLLRDARFGEVSNHPAVTRHVEGARLDVPGIGSIELYDTPGLEDSIGLLERLNTDAPTTRAGIEQVRAFLQRSDADSRFAQEAKALRQVLASDVALYVVDARDRVLAKFRDELEILSRCARPVVPVLNFTASDAAHTASWRTALAELNLHAVAEFDTVVFDQAGEVRLFEKMRTLLDAHRALLDGMIEMRRAQRQELIVDSASLLADLLVDVAAHQVTVPLADRDEAQRRVEAFKNTIRAREQRCVTDLLGLHRFREDDYASMPLPIEDGQWGPDLFSPAALKQFGVRTGGAAAAGAATGLALDVMFGGLSLGAWTALGATFGAAVGLGQTHGRRMIDRVRGYTELRCDDATLTVLAARQVALTEALLQRGHAAVAPIATDRTNPTADRASLQWTKPILSQLDEARLSPSWSSLSDRRSVLFGSARRDDVVRRIAAAIRSRIASPPAP